MIVDQDFAPTKKVWTPHDIKNSGEIIHWIETAPNAEVIGWLTIGEGEKSFHHNPTKSIPLERYCQ